MSFGRWLIQLTYHCFSNADLTAGKYSSVWDPGLLPLCRVTVAVRKTMLHINFNREVYKNYKNILSYSDPVMWSRVCLDLVLPVQVLKAKGS